MSLYQQSLKKFQKKSLDDWTFYVSMGADDLILTAISQLRREIDKLQRENEQKEIDKLEREQKEIDELERKQKEIDKLEREQMEIDKLQREIFLNYEEFLSVKSYPKTYSFDLEGNFWN